MSVLPSKIATDTVLWIAVVGSSRWFEGPLYGPVGLERANDRVSSLVSDGYNATVMGEPR